MNKYLVGKLALLPLIAALGACSVEDTSNEDSDGSLVTQETYEPDSQEGESANGLSFEEWAEETEVEQSHEIETVKLEDHTNQPIEEKEDIAHQEFPVDMEEAVTQFIEETGQEELNISELSFVQDHGEFTYHLYGWDGTYHYYGQIDAETGEQLSYVEEESSKQLDYIEWRDVLPPIDAMQFGIEEARADSATDWKLFVEDQNNFTVYEVVIQDGENQYINAYNGNILPRENIEE